MVIATRRLKKLNNLGGTKAAFAPDFGMIYHMDGIHNLSPKIAVSVQNIGDLDFEKVGKIPMTVNTGIATESELQGFDIILAADYHDLTRRTQACVGGEHLHGKKFKTGSGSGMEPDF
ncbi:MAG: hypothetical protein CM15mP66_08280 [Pseudomonadota bacterium]|nr:MAG: hypothetical protein CM15mP66_08280 [Pseudomonadota bacterium]